MNKFIISAAMLCILSLQTIAQSGTNSPYSQYGLGVLSDQSQGVNRGMGGLSMGVRGGNQVNALNPASYSAVDSLTMLFDIGLSGQITNFKEGSKKVNANNANIEYAVAMFRAMPKLGVGLGILPYTNVGYSYNSSSTLGSNNLGMSQFSTTESHSGTGGLTQAFVGIGWQATKRLSLGANISYLWGNFDRSVSVSNSDNYVNTVTRNYYSSMSSYRLDFGVQYVQPLDGNNILTFGATYGLGHSLGADAVMTMTSSNSQTNVTLDEKYTITDAISIPHSFAAGATWKHKNRLTVGVDYSLQKWGSIDFPDVDYNSKDNYVLKSNMLSDRHKIIVGGEFVPEEFSRKFFKRIHYRIGASYATPYVKVNGQDGPKEYSVSAGFGIPFYANNSRPSMLNISGQWTRSDASGLVTENVFRINIGLTFNERWFAKWKVE